MPDAFFKKVMDTLIMNEGYESNVPADKGGQTYAGISRVFNPEWPGWGIIDGKTTGDLWDHVVNFYWAKFQYWQLDKLAPSDLASYMFDTGVLFGGGRMVKATQGAMNALAASEAQKIQCDGVMGPKTVARLTALSPPEREAVLAQLVAWRVSHHLAVVHRDIVQRKFLVGWLARAVRF